MIPDPNGYGRIRSTVSKHAGGHAGQKRKPRRNRRKR